MIIAVYSLNRKFQNMTAVIHRQDWNVTSDRFGKYYLDVQSSFRSENHLHDFHCEKDICEIAIWLSQCGFRLVRVTECEVKACNG